jgi:hypothetical protein
MGEAEKVNGRADYRRIAEERMSCRGTVAACRVKEEI